MTVRKILRSQTSHIKVSQPRGPLGERVELDLRAEHVPNVERMMRGVMIACGISKEEIERLLRDRRERESSSIN